MIKNKLKSLTVAQLACLNTLWLEFGKNPKNGKRKGKNKIHTIINADEIVPSLVYLAQQPQTITGF